jgi:phytoene synthase
MIEQAKQYCYAKAARPDSALYYSLRGLKPTERDLVVAVHAFYQEIEDIVFECKDYEFASQKFNWWRSEVVRLCEGTPDHPVMLLLQACVKQPASIQEKLFSIIDALEDNLHPAPFATFEEVVIHFMRTAGQRELLIYELLQKDNAISAEKIYQLMLVAELVNYVQHLHDYVQREIIYFPLDELEQFQVTNQMLHELKTTPELKKLLQHQAEKIKQAYAKGFENVVPSQRAALSSLLIRCEIAFVTLKEIQASEYTVMENLIHLTPLRSWWIAWRKRI